MSKKTAGFSVIEALIILLVISAISVGGWYVAHNRQTGTHKASNTTTEHKTTQPTQNTKPSDPSEGGKYLVIKEWGVRSALPEGLWGKVAYKIQTATDPDTDLLLQAATIFISSSSLKPNLCAIDTTNIGPSVLTGIQYIRSSQSKPFNANRYRGNFKENVLTASGYAYHLNYITPDCVGEANIPTIESLQTALIQLVQLE